MASQEERNKRLDALAQAVKDWAKNQRNYLQTQSSLAKRILKGRTGSERLAQSSVNSIAALTTDQINDFLTGD